MADSSITKKALAASLKELMNELPFSKINIGDICEKCEMNRKSFYYHFKDKYDLVNWIYQTEFISVASEREYDDVWAFIYDICTYLYKNKPFYCKAMQIEGQNSFFDYFREVLLVFMAEYINTVFSGNDNVLFYANFWADAFTLSIKRWMLEKEILQPQEFIEMLKTCMHYTAK